MNFHIAVIWNAHCIGEDQRLSLTTRQGTIPSPSI